MSTGPAHVEELKNSEEEKIKGLFETEVDGRVNTKKDAQIKGVIKKQNRMSIDQDNEVRERKSNHLPA